MVFTYAFFAALLVTSVADFAVRPTITPTKAAAAPARNANVFFTGTSSPSFRLLNQFLFMNILHYLESSFKATNQSCLFKITKSSMETLSSLSTIDVFMT